MEQVTKMNFKGQSIYVGIDVHKKSWTATFFVDKIDNHFHLQEKY